MRGWENLVDLSKVSLAARDGFVYADAGSSFNANCRELFVNFFAGGTPAYPGSVPM